MRWEDIRTILVVFDSDLSEQNQEMHATIDRMKAEGKRVTECMYVDKKKAYTCSIDCRVVVDRKCVDLMGRPVGVPVRQLMDNERFDIVIDVSEHTVMTYVTLAVEAKMKCGRQSDNHILDFQIEGEMEQDKLVAEVVRYLKMINK